MEVYIAGAIFIIIMIAVFLLTKDIGFGLLTPIHPEILNEFQKKTEEIMGLPLEIEYWLMHGSLIAYVQAEALGFIPEAYGFIKGKKGRYTMEEAIKSKQNSPFYDGAIPSCIKSDISNIKQNIENNDESIPSYIKRMAEEKNQLQERCNKLVDFIESGKAAELPHTDYMDLLLQLNAMEEYKLILERRLDRAFKKEGI